MTDPTAQTESALAARYRVERELGRGGMATVYLAQDLKLHRQVVLKVLRPALRLTDARPAPSGRGGAGVAEAAIGPQGPERYSVIRLEAASSPPVGSLAFRE